MYTYISVVPFSEETPDGSLHCTRNPTSRKADIFIFYVPGGLELDALRNGETSET
jgi:hypothetical protein